MTLAVRAPRDLVAAVTESARAPIDFVRRMGSGRFSRVYEICNRDKPSLRCIVKHVTSGSQADVKEEYDFQLLCHGAGLAVRPYSLGLRPKFIAMERIDQTLADFLRNRQPEDVLQKVLFTVIDLIYRLADLNITHGDMHWENIGFIYKMGILSCERVPVLLDFGSARHGAHAEAEMVQLIRTAYPLGKENMIQDPYNRKWLRDRLLTIYQNNFGPVSGRNHFEVRFHAIEDAWNADRCK